MDDSAQDAPPRPGMGPLVAAGAIHVEGHSVIPLENGLKEICCNYGMLPNEEFKWSPPRDSWMRNILINDDRDQFFRECLSLAKGQGVTAWIVIQDTNARFAISSSQSPEEDATRLLLERANNHLDDCQRNALVIADRPSGGTRIHEDNFIAGCLETLESGTDFVLFDRLAFVVTANSRHLRLLQLADLITSCTRAFVAGNKKHHGNLFQDAIQPLLRTSTRGVAGGFGLKIHPDHRYGNLYHWLLGDAQTNEGELYPRRFRAYSGGADTP